VFFVCLCLESITGDAAMQLLQTWLASICGHEDECRANGHHVFKGISREGAKPSEDVTERLAPELLGRMGSTRGVVGVQKNVAVHSTTSHLMKPPILIPFMIRSEYTSAVSWGVLNGCVPPFFRMTKYNPERVRLEPAGTKAEGANNRVLFGRAGDEKRRICIVEWLHSENPLQGKARFLQQSLF
jgi:hypothetical protein